MGNKSIIKLIVIALIYCCVFQKLNAMDTIQKTINLDYNGKTICLNKFQNGQNGKIAVILHGMVLYGDYYHNAIDYLPPDYTDFYFIDMLHHGHSGGEKGILPNQDTIMLILDFVFDYILKNEKVSKIDLIMGESMGGIFALHYLLNNPIPYSPYVVIFSTPLKINYLNFIDFKNINLVGNFLFSRDKLVVPVKELNKELIDDSILWNKINSDTLVPNLVNVNYLLTLKKMIKFINRNYSKLDMNILFIYGEYDAISNARKIEKKNAKYDNLKTIVLEDQPHAIFWNTNNNYKNVIGNWLNENEKQ